MGGARLLELLGPCLSSFVQAGLVGFKWGGGHSPNLTQLRNFCMAMKGQRHPQK